ncbi:MAG: DUF4249 domain-containing protein [Sphingobacteriales bacterium]|jgi:hypothetical protein|nr:DUF4249 domain-containing protein [Sphingobacteriales bacterium]OJW31703.1 MAG: hypothetical protein BGO54_14740 [Sphingobacteriales bacterium 46-32]
MYKFFLLSISFALLLATGCRDPYRPEVVTKAPNYLVIEGVLNAGQGATNVRLTRTTQIDRTSSIIGEASAMVTVEGKDNSAVPLAYQGNGLYIHPNLNLVIGNEYRLRVKTTDGKEYLSAYVVAKTTPPIDSVTWSRSATGGVDIKVNSHDDANKTKYYRWEYDETWEIRTYFFSKYIYENRRVRERVMPAEDVSTCWRNRSSTNILVGTTTRLESDVISKMPVTSFSNGDDRIGVRYSILVRQYALDKDAYEFYDLLRKNTESIGTIFDAQPSEVKGNITCLTDPSVPVIGYVTASSIEEKRIFISASQVPDWRFPQICEVQTVTPDSVVYYFEILGYSPFEADIPPGTIVPKAYFGSYGVCVDCTKRNGTRTRPSFW